jgi:hypothetical protein
MTWMTCSLCEELCTFMVIPWSAFLRMRNIWDNFTENQNAHFKFSICFEKTGPFWDNVENYSTAV